MTLSYHKNYKITSWIKDDSDIFYSDITDSKIRSPFRFPGSKYQAIKFIEPFWKAVDHDEYREPFVGGGAVFFAKPKAKYNWINEIDTNLYITYKVIQNRILRKNLINLVTKQPVTKERHTELKNLNPTNNLDIAFRYYYLNRTSYSGVMKQPAWGYHLTKSVPPSKWGVRIEEAGKKLEDIKITNFDFEEVILAPSEGKKVFMFIDPPYYEADQKRAYVHSFQEYDHIRLSKILKKTNYKFCLTYDDCISIRKLYDWAKIRSVSWRYHTANANTSNRNMGKEVIISNI